MSARFWAPLLLIVAGCAYTFNPSLPGHIKTVEIPTVQNETLEVGLTDLLTQDLTDRFVSTNQIQVVQKNADSVLEADITGYENKVFTFNAQQGAQEYVVIITVSMSFRDRVKNKELWSEDAVRGTATYAAGGSGQTANSEEEARKLAAKQIVDFAASRTLEGW